MIRDVVETCFACGTAFDPDLNIFRTTTCPNCGKDAHVCLNCRFYDKSVHMECRESIAEPVAQKDRSNFCEYFKMRKGSGPGLADGDRANRAREAAGQLFGDL